MRAKHITFGVLVSVLSLTLISGCGGSKETLDFEPDPFPEVEEPVATESVTVTPEPQLGTIEDIQPQKPIILRTVNFEFDRYSLTSEAKAILAENARQLLENPDTKIRIEGHCDERGTVEYNLALGERRAMTTRDYLMSYGINPNRITIISYGKERPLDPRHTPDAWDKNRRAEFIKLN